MDASWVEGFLKGSGELLYHDDALFGVFDAWLAGLPADVVAACRAAAQREGRAGWKLGLQMPTTTDEFFDTSAFSDPGQDVKGNARPGIVRGPAAGA